MSKLLIAALVLLCGCERHVTNEEIIAEAAKCTKAGMGYAITRSAITMDVNGVRCDYPSK